MKLPVLMTLCLALSGGGTGAVAQTPNSAQTGAGGALESLEALQAEVNEKLPGPPGQIVKGAVGLAGLVAALSAAQSALTFQRQLRGDGSWPRAAAPASTRRPQFPPRLRPALQPPPTRS